MVPAYLDTLELSRAGWGVVYGDDALPGIEGALEPLLLLRRQQAGRLYREFRGTDGHRPEERSQDWLRRHGAKRGRTEPERVPYYLLLVGNATQIPFSFQLDLASHYAVGRLDFPDLADYAEYARRQVRYETRWEPSLPKSALVFAPVHDIPTRKFFEAVVEPMISEGSPESLTARRLGFQLRTHVREDATKAALQRTFRDDPAALIFLGGHGAGLPTGHPEQRMQQGALVCQDFSPGPVPWPKEGVLAATDLDTGDLKGAIVLAAVEHFAGFLPDPLSPEKANTADSFVAALPSEMLKRGAQAVIGKAGTMYLSTKSEDQKPLYFQEILHRLMLGRRAGEALGLLSQLAAELAVLLLESQESAPEAVHIKQLEFADARYWLLLGDPAARLRVEEMASLIDDDRLDDSLPSLPEPEVPPDLASACAQDECVAVCGWGLNAKLGGMTWRAFLRGLVRFAVEHQWIKEAQGAQHLKALREGLTGEVADSLSAQVSAQSVAEFVRTLPDLGERAPGAFGDLAELNFQGVISASFRALGHRLLHLANPPSYLLEDATSLKEAHAQNRPFVLNLYGTDSRPESMVLSDVEYQKRVAGNLQFTQFLEGLLASRTLFFLGCSLAGIERYFQALSSKFLSGPRHYALVAAHEPNWKVKADSLLSRYNTEVLPYTDETHQAVDRFVARLGAQTQELRRSLLAAAPKADPGVTGIHLEDIGPFRHLKLDFTDKWHLLLGDNGVGKSTILKALAVAIAGEEARSYAGRLLRVGCTFGKITLFTRRQPSGYTIEIAQGESETSVRCTPSRVMDAEPFLALSFPPVRGIGWSPVAGPQTTGGANRPVVADLIPILRGDDPRTETLKQWIVNLDYQRKSDVRAGRVLTAFLAILEKLAVGVDLQSIEVSSTFQVLVKSHETSLPIELLSQGTASLLSWIGLLVQRLYELNDFAEDSLSRYALVLIDELDAHMHPGWQLRLVYELKHLFPNVQFLASTHSPLLIGGLSPGEVTRLERIDGRVVPAAVEAEMLLGRAEDRLTNPLFGLRTSLDPGTQALVKRYKVLLGKRNPTAEEREERARLEPELKTRMPIGEEVEVRLQAEAVAEAADLCAEQPTKEEWRELIARITELRQALGGG